MHTSNDVIRELTPSQVERFWAKVEKVDEGCWKWRGAIHPKGYGTWTVTRRPGAPTVHASIRPHRLTWWLLRGPIPDGYVIDHLCSNKACVNPEHLEPIRTEMNGSRAPLDALASLNAEAEIERIIASADSPRAAAQAVIAAVRSHPDMLDLMRRPSLRVEI